MKNLVKLSVILFLIVTIACSLDDDSGNNSVLQPFGTMHADFDGETINLNVDKAKEYPGTNGFLTIMGRNCSEGKILVRFDIQIGETGDFTLEELGFTSYLINAASACPDETGGSTPLIISEANVSVIELSNTHIKGTFNIIATTGVVPKIIENGFFDIEIEN